MMLRRTHRHGAQGVMDTASHATLENEFGTKNEDECITKILEKGQPQLTQVTRHPSNFGVHVANHPNRLMSVVVTVMILWAQDKRTRCCLE